MSGQEKTHAHIYLHAIDRLNVNSANCLLIGDYINDAEVGMQITIEDDYPDIDSLKIYNFSQLIGYKRISIFDSPACMLRHNEGLLTGVKAKEEALQLYNDVLEKLNERML